MERTTRPNATPRFSWTIIPGSSSAVVTGNAAGACVMPETLLDRAKAAIGISRTAPTPTAPARGGTWIGRLGYAPVVSQRRPSQERGTQRRTAPPDLVVMQPLKDFTCAECGTEPGNLLVMEDKGPLCMDCADMDHLVFVPSGDAASPAAILYVSAGALQPHFVMFC